MANVSVRVKEKISIGLVLFLIKQPSNLVVPLPWRDEESLYLNA